jgi:branched-chain amino acid aminotransferase
MAEERSATVWVDGELRPGGASGLSPFDHGFTVGDGVFETLVVEDGTPFAARRHLGRLRRSAAGLGLAVPRSDDELRAAMAAVVEAGGLTTGRARLRLTVSSGAGPLGSGRGAASTVVVAAGPVIQRGSTASVVVVPWTRNEHSAVVGIKTTSYAENVVALARAHESGASEAVFANTAGNLCEGAGSNVFVVLDGQLVTPPLAAGCLAGVTRELICELLDADVVERDVPIGDLARVEEGFLTSSTREVQPIDAIDGRPLAAVGGPHTTAAAIALAELKARDVDP